MQVYHDKFLLFLQQEYMRRLKAHPGYSLRTFAKALGCEPIAVSRYFSGKRKISPKTIIKIAKNLGLSPEEVEKYLNRTNKKRGPDVIEDKYIQLENDTFEIISNWKYFAILEITYLSDFEPNIDWIAKKLGLTKLECNFAVETLQRVGMLEIGKDGRWIDKYEFLSGNVEGFTDSARRLLQKQIIQQSLDALENTPITERSQTSMTFSGSREKIEKAKELIKQFRRDLTDLMKEDDHRDHVYQLCVSLFPITK